MKKPISFLAALPVLIIFLLCTELFAADITSGIYIEDTAITTSDQVQSGSDVALLAVGSITLQPGFHAEEGSLFKAIIRDNDGLTDIWEMENFGNLDQGPSDNPDGDHLVNLLELQYDTDPNVVDPDGDLDGDGLGDAWETAHFGNLSQGPSDDPDNDLLNNAWEYTYGTDPNVANQSGDADADGLDDTWEIAHFGSLAQGPLDNPDGDHLNNALEYQYGKDPNVADPDGDLDADGLSDVWEVTHFGSLAQGPADNPDNDHLTNALEFQFDTNPNVADPDGDLDGDGMSDVWEYDHFGNLNQSADGDADGDGVSNHVEFLGNSDPNSAADKPKRGTRYEYDEIGRIKKIIRIK